MSLVRYYAAATLDGYIAETDDTLYWLLKYEGEFEGADSDEGQAGGMVGLTYEVRRQRARRRAPG